MTHQGLVHGQVDKTVLQNLNSTLSWPLLSIKQDMDMSKKGWTFPNQFNALWLVKVKLEFKPP